MTLWLSEAAQRDVFWHLDSLKMTAFPSCSLRRGMITTMSSLYQST